MASLAAHHMSEQLIYGYVPTEWICALYVALFGLTTLIHLGQSIRYRLWWLVPTIVTGGLAEVIGWCGRLWSSQSPYILNPFLMQITTTIMAPSFITAANFVMLGVVIVRLGPQYSRLSPRLYSIVFITADLIALIVQAVGGAMASQAAETGIGNPNNGANVMCGGIFWQLAAMTVYCALAFEFLFRLAYNKPIRPGKPRPGVEPTEKSDAETAVEVRPSFGYAQGSPRATRITLMIVALATSTVFIYMRSIYRTIELLGGWSGRIITTEVYFNVLDAMPITFALYTINVLHPGWLLYGRVWQENSEKEIPLEPATTKSAEA